jgi:hypothetical protein
LIGVVRKERHGDMLVRRVCRGKRAMSRRRRADRVELGRFLKGPRAANEQHDPQTRT